MAEIRSNNEREREREREVYGENSQKIYFTSLMNTIITNCLYSIITLRSF